MRRFIYLSLVGLFLMNLVFCYRDKPATRLPANTKDLSVLRTRSVMVQECGHCHPKEFENEMKGPHSHSLKNLYAHRDIANKSDHYAKEYAIFLNKITDETCIRCHTGENLYENSFKELVHNDNWADYMKTHKQLVESFPVARKDSLSSITGVDCLTCHQMQDNVITDPAHADRTAACKPMGNTFYATNNNCISCHGFANQSMTNNLHNPKITADLKCLSCHQEYDNTGKPTHYMYWRHDPADKARLPVKQGIFDDLEVQVKATGKDNVLALRWENKRSPHDLSECGEMIVTIEVLDNNQKVLYTDECRINNKVVHDSVLQPWFGKKAIPGVVGYAFKPTEAAFNKSSKLPGGVPKSGIIRVTAFDKAQYWIDDREGQKVYERTQKYTL